MMSARLLHYTPPEEQGRLYHICGRVVERVIAFYARTLQVVLRYQTITLLIAVAILMLTAVLYISIPKGFFPTQDTGIIQGISQASGSTSFESMAEKQQELAKVLLTDPAVESISSFIGADGTNTTLNSGRIDINLKPAGQRGITATGVINRLGPKLANVEGIRFYMQPVQDITVDARVSRTEYQYTLEDPNRGELNAAVHDLLWKLRQLPELTDVVTDQQLDGLAVSLTIDRPTAARFGITPQTIDNTLYDAFGQRQINTLYTKLNQYHVILETDPKFQLRPQRLHDIYIQSSSSSSSSSTATSNTAGSSSGAGAGVTASPGNALLTASATAGLSSPASSTSALAAGTTGTTTSSASNANSTSALSSSSTSTTSTNVLTSTSTSSSISSSANTSASGTSRSATSSTAGGSTGTGATVIQTPVPLNAFTHVQTQSEALSIAHQGQFPAVTISFNLSPGYSLGQALNAVNKVVSHSNLPAGIIANYQGTAAAFESSLSNEGLLILAALVTVYIVLGVLYESFIHPITILSTLPSAGVGALLALRLFHLDLDIVALIGIILLIGIVQKNGIMMVDFALEAERGGGKSATEAIYQAAVLRFRPILMTTLAALLSGIPLAFGSGIGSELRKPLGVAMVGGLLFSQILTLYTTPVIYIFFDNLAARFARRRPDDTNRTQPEMGPA
jgi:multidrug efflux pump